MRKKRSSRAIRAKRRILIVDGQSLVRRGITALIDTEPDLTVCAAAATRQEGLAAIACSRPDLVIAELCFGEGDGLGLLKDIHARYEDLPVLVFSMHAAGVYAQRAFQAGASGYLCKQEMSETLLDAIRRVLNGEQYVSPPMATIDRTHTA